MTTPLRVPVSRETLKTCSGRPVIITLAPAGSQNEALIELRLKGKRTRYLVALSDLYRVAALWHGQALAAARREARKKNIPWRVAKRDFETSRRIEPVKPQKQGK